MARIHRMDEHLTNMIAAGEVVERPMGVVKECVENSIDAQSTRIEVWITQGGIEQIEIYDNGVGMDKADALMAFERHATSKIQTVQDLWNISTLGFRGEALPSIASVAQVELRTCNGSESNRVIVSYGVLEKAEPFGCNPGTELIVRGLFQKTPARLKHLKSAQYEAALITDVMQKFAMSHPEIAFRLVVDGRETFKTTGSGNLKEILYTIYGKEAAYNCFEIEGEDFDAKVTGLGVLPSISRANRNYITLFINHRMIRSFKLQKVIVDAYHHYMPEERFPIAIVHIELDEQLIDVNVHPSKWEIRLSKEQQLTLLLKESIEASLAKHMQAPKVEKIKNTTVVEQPRLFEEKKPLMTAEPKAAYGAVVSNSKEEKKPERVFKEEEIQLLFPEKKESVDTEPKVEKVVEVQQEKPVEFKNRLPQLEVLAQLHQKYILASSEEGLVIIDQHAAEERANYERLLEQFETKQAETMELLVPLQLNVSAALIAQLDALNQLVQELNIEFEAFSENSLIVRSIPLWMQPLDETAFLQDVLDDFEQENNLGKAHLNKDRIATQACHHSIRFNRTLTREEMEKVIQDLNHCKQPFHCPHGRPTMITISEAQLMKEFKR